MPYLRILHELTLPDAADSEAFEDFLREDYLPAVHQGPTRVGQVMSVTLARRGDGASVARFLLDTAFSGLGHDRMPRVDDDEVRLRFEEFGVTVKHLGNFLPTASWDNPAAI